MTKHDHFGPPNSQQFPPMSLEDVKTYDLASRPSKVFYSDMGQVVGPDTSIADWLDALPEQLAGRVIRRVCESIAEAHRQRRTVVAAIGGHVIKTGCAPYLIDWIESGVLTGIAMNGAAAIHDVELALAGKTSEDVATQLAAGEFGFARDTADVFAVAAREAGGTDLGLGWALGRVLSDYHCEHPECSILLAAYRRNVPCTVHVALGTDIVHMHPHVSGEALGGASMVDFRRLCRLVASMDGGVWLNLGSAVIMPEVFLKAVAVARNLGYELENLTTINVDKQSHYRSRVNVLERPCDEGLELTGHHEILIPLLHVGVAARLAAARGRGQSSQRAA